MSSKLSGVLRSQGRTAIWLAKEIGKTKFSIYKYSDGSALPSGDTAKQIADILESEVKDLFPNKYDYCPCCNNYTIKNTVITLKKENIINKTS